MKEDENIMVDTKPNDEKCESSPKRGWSLVLLLALSFGFGELSHFLVGVTSRPMAQDIGYGDQSCLKNSSLSQVEGFEEIVCENLNETSCNDFTINGTSFCHWNYNGLGIEYQILAGPSFILAFTIGGLVLGALADRYKRVVLIGLSTFLFSLFTIVMGFCSDVWQLILLRLAIAFGESACQPISASLVGDLFPQALHGMALGIVNLGIYFGYGLSYVVGNYIPPANILGQGWRWSYYISGIPGLFIGAVLMFAVAEPQRKTRTRVKDEEPRKAAKKHGSFLSKCWKKLKYFFKPTILQLCLAASIRHTAGFSWAYNSQLYYQTYYPEWDVALWLFSVSIVAGSLGVFLGGIFSDKVTKRLGLQARAWVLAASQLLAAPFAAGVLLLPPPYSFVSLLIACLFAEMWFGVLFAILVEVIPAEVCSFTIGIFLFIMNNVGGNLPVIIDPISKSIGYREAILLMYPGLLVLSAVLFVLFGVIIRKEARTSK